MSPVTCDALHATFGLVFPLDSRRFHRFPASSVRFRNVPEHSSPFRTLPYVSPFHDPMFPLMDDLSHALLSLVLIMVSYDVIMVLLLSQRVAMPPFPSCI